MTVGTAELPTLDGTRRRRPGRPRPLPRVLWLALVTITVVGFGLVSSRSTAPPDTAPRDPDVVAAAETVNRLLDPRVDVDPLASLPADFSAVTGVRYAHATAPDGTQRGVHVGGGCSAPWGDDNTRWDYRVGCQAHDLGYDLLRYAQAKGEPLGGELRYRLDAQLSTDMHYRCEDNPRDTKRLCHTVASLYTAGMVLNSWHQRWGPPTGEPIGPWVFGLLVVGLLLGVRLGAWGRSGGRTAAKPARASRPPADVPSIPAQQPIPTQQFSPAQQASADRYLALLRVASLVGIVLGTTVVIFANWRGGGSTWWWPLTWLCQLAVVFFFAGGHANLHSWRAVYATGGGFLHYLTGRMSWLLRPVLALILALVVVPVSLELLGVDAATTERLTAITAQPLWLLGCYLLTVMATPLMAWLHARAPLTVPLVLAGVVLLFGPLAGWLGVSADGSRGILAGLALALLAQQLGFGYADGAIQRLPRPALLGAVLVGGLGLALLIRASGQSSTLLPTTEFVPPLGVSASALLFLGLAQLGVLLLLRGPLTRLSGTTPVWRVISFTRATPMTLYLGLLAVVILAVAAVHLPEAPAAALGGLSWLLQPRQLTALALLAIPALLAFWCSERGDGFRWAFGWSVPSVDSMFARLATVLGVGFGLLGVFGFALAGLNEVVLPEPLTELSTQPLTNVLHLVLGWFLLHAVRGYRADRLGTWLLTALACLPPMLMAGDTTVERATTVAVHGMPGLLALAAAIAITVNTVRMRTRAAAPVR
ncbi:phospholipase A2-like protein [Tamaricihabitans halophyticus]|uniref:Phospholipase A2-like protein n=1 Tax=Tamaricihabitans halophyticus TaxID=1262583 RepID=A0A4R2QET4_9PSEU|nr:phospholipase A2 [Tamaricihabitans halophyticus]TCP46798.1 phospholipase A2-like protein [Tamaricihabitans halophyticus]